MTAYTDKAHNISYDLDPKGYAEMTCRTCDRTFTGRPADTTSENAPYDPYGDPACNTCATSRSIRR
jgi:hypothetical protein